MTSHPAAVLLALLCVLLLLVSWRLLTAAPGSKLPPALSSPWTSVPCLLLLAVTSAKLHATSSQMGEVRQQLEQAEWRIKQGWVASLLEFFNFDIVTGMNTQYSMKVPAKLNFKVEATKILLHCN